jgi:hypothetical protein
MLLELPLEPWNGAISGLLAVVEFTSSCRTSLFTGQKESAWRALVK